MLIAVLYAIAETWKQPKCPSTEEWIKKVWYIYTIEYYSAMKKKEIMAFMVTWMELEIIMLRVRPVSYAITCMWNLKKKKGYNELLCRIGTDSQTLKNLLFPKETSCGAGGGGNGLRVWEGNAIKLGCDDHCATINVTKFTELKIKKKIFFKAK